MTADPTDVNDADDADDAVITAQDYADARARHAGRGPLVPEMFGGAVTGNGVTGDTLLGSDDTPEEPPRDTD